MKTPAPRILACAAALAALFVVAAPASAQQRLIVGLRAGVHADRLASVADARVVPRLNAVSIVPLGPTAQAARRLRRSPLVRYVEVDGAVHALDASPDPGRVAQWGLDAVGAPLAWSVTRGAGIVVAVVDTGIAPAPDLEGRLLAGWNVIDMSADAVDDNGHGTHVAGTIGENAENGLAEAGLAPEVSLLPVKVLDASGSGTDSDVAAGIVWAADHAARVVNLSLGGATSSRLLSDAVKYATAHGVLIVAAAGNESGPVGYPARIATRARRGGGRHRPAACALLEHRHGARHRRARRRHRPADAGRLTRQLRGRDAQRHVDGDTVRDGGRSARARAEADGDPCRASRARSSGPRRTSAPPAATTTPATGSCGPTGRWEQPG